MSSSCYRNRFTDVALELKRSVVYEIISLEYIYIYKYTHTHTYIYIYIYIYIYFIFIFIFIPFNIKKKPLIPGASIKGQNELFHSIDFPVLNVVFLFKPAGTVVVSPAVSTPCQPTLKSASIVKGDKSHDRTFDDNCFHVTQDGCQDGVSDIVVFRGWRARVAVRNQSAVSKHTSLRQER